MQAWLKVGGAIVSAAIAACSTAFIAFNFKPDFPWKYIALIAELIFILLVFWGWYSAENRIRQLEKLRPSIEVKPNGFCLEVKNKGAFATFSANIKIHDKTYSHPDEQYGGWWQRARYYETEIKTDDFDNILIASLNKFPADPHARMAEDTWRERLEIHYYDSSSLNVHSWQSLWYTRGDYHQPQTFPEYELEITIVANPGLSKRFARNYILNITGLYEVRAKR